MREFRVEFHAAEPSQEVAADQVFVGPAGELCFYGPPSGPNAGSMAVVIYAPGTWATVREVIS